MNFSLSNIGPKAAYTESGSPRISSFTLKANRTGLTYILNEYAGPSHLGVESYGKLKFAV